MLAGLQALATLMRSARPLARPPVAAAALRAAPAAGQGLVLAQRLSTGPQHGPPPARPMPSAFTSFLNTARSLSKRPGALFVGATAIGAIGVGVWAAQVWGGGACWQPARTRRVPHWRALLGQAQLSRPAAALCARRATGASRTGGWAPARQMRRRP